MRDNKSRAGYHTCLLLVHQFEEYALNIVDGNYVIVEQVFANAGSIMDLSALPMFHFPLVNIVLVWAGATTTSRPARSSRSERT